MSQNKSLFERVPMDKPARSTFDLSHWVRTSGNMGWIMPICAMEALPGSSFRIRGENMLRFQPLVSPVLHEFTVTQHYWFIPWRIVWENFDDWVYNDGSKPLPAAPYITMDGNTAINFPLANYLGIPQNGTATTDDISALPFAAYQATINENYRDQNLQPEINYKLVDGANPYGSDLMKLRRACWEHDYLTSALPFEQKGQAVEIPGGDVQLKANWNSQGNPHFQGGSSAIPTGGVTSQASGVGFTGDILVNGTTTVAYDPDGSLFAPMATVNELRKAERLQEFLEILARGGSRPKEIMKNMFDVNPQDARLDVPEYITGMKTPVVISEVLNTAASSGQSQGRAQGDMAGHGVSIGGGVPTRYTAMEHGMVLGVMVVRPKTAYMNGIPKMFTKLSDPFQYAWPKFAQIGEQPIERREVYGFSTNPDSTFGFIPRYSEYKYANDLVTGDFRTTLKHWTAVRDLPSTVALNEQFVECNPTHDIFAVTNPNVHKLLIQVRNDVQCTHPLPFYGVPTL